MTVATMSSTMTASINENPRRYARRSMSGCLDDGITRSAGSRAVESKLRSAPARHD
jgi:hypothetical protein